GVYLGWIDRVPGMGRGFAILRKTVAVLMLAGAVVVGMTPGGPFRKMEERPGIEWQEWSDRLLTEAAGSGRPVMIDFSADWCIPCHELELITFTDEQVLELSSGFTTLKVDLTRSGETEKALKERFDVRGVPTIVFFGPSGREVPGARITGFVGPEVMLEKMRSAMRDGG
ncbi:MAG TPA: thioredoxin family protein, partial [Candidatus Krumholzibacterium sp.]|nr:thioredoxin family protein [Candidatus Krumholzibacterium sp.]